MDQGLFTSNDYSDDLKYLFISNTTRYDISNNLKIRNIFGYSYSSDIELVDDDSTNLPVFDGTYLPSHVRGYSEELQIQGTSLENKLNWVAGAFFSDIPALRFNELQFNTFGRTHDQDTKTGDKAKAIYSQATYELASDLKATAGIRYTWDSRFSETKQLTGTGACPTPTPAGVGPDCGFANSGNFRAPTWDVSLDYQVKSGLMVYAASRRGWRAGGFNAKNVQETSFRSFAPETLTDAELGTKISGDVGGAPATLTTDVFYQDYKNIQTSQLVFDGMLETNLITNAAAARAYGSETEVGITPIMGLHLGGYFSWLDFKYTAVGPGVDLTSVIDQRAKFKYGLTGEYTLPSFGNIGQFRFNASWGWTSSTGFVGTPGASLPSQGMLNLGADWNNVAGGPVDVSIFVTNAVNSAALSRVDSLYTSVGIAQGQYVPPRMYGLKLRYHFGAK